MNERNRNRAKVIGFAVPGAACLTAVGMFAAWDSLRFHVSPAVHSRKHGDAESLWAVLKMEVRSGDSAPNVEQSIALARSWNIGAKLNHVVVLRRDENWR